MYYTTDSPQNQMTDQEFQYFGFDPRNKLCWCGNTPPFSPRPMKDCNNEQRYASRIYSHTNASELFCKETSSCGYLIFFHFQNNCVIIKSYKVVIMKTTNLFAKYYRKKMHCHTPGIKIGNNAGQDSNVQTICWLIGEELHFIPRAIMIPSSFTVSITAIIVNIVEAMAVRAHGIHCMIMKSHLNSKLIPA